LYDILGKQELSAQEMLKGIIEPVDHGVTFVI